MRLIDVGDLHLRAKKPINRTDNFLAEQEKKFRFIISQAVKNECPLIFNGDVFDSHNVPFGLVEKYMKILKESNVKTYFIFGQHDQRYHTADKNNTPLGVLLAGTLKQSFSLTEEPVVMNDCSIYGASYGETIIEPTIGDTNILVVHLQVVEKEVPFFMDNAITAKDLCEKYPTYNLFLCGDNHTQFCYKHPETDQLVINPGSVMRTTIAQIDHEPAIYLIDTETNSYETIKIPIEWDVLDDTIKQNKEALSEKIVSFVDSLGKEYNAELSFLDNIEKAKQKIDKDVADILSEVITN